MTPKLLLFAFLSSVIALGTTACGTGVPQLSEPWQGKDIDTKIAYSIKKKIFCELSDAIERANHKYKVDPGSGQFVPILPDNYGVQVQTNLIVEEETALNPLVTLNRTLPNGFSSGVTNISQNFNIGFGATASSTATRTDTSYSYYLVGKIGHGQEKKYCASNEYFYNPEVIPPFIKSDLGIYDFLVNEAIPSDVLSSSPKLKAKTPKLDVYSYEIKFVVVTNGNINPMWKLVPVSGGGGAALLQFDRSRTHDLTLTFGPNAEDGFGPDIVSLNQQLSANFRSALNRRN